MDEFRKEVQEEDASTHTKKVDESGISGKKGYGGEFGIETDRMDKSAVGHDYQE
jgi:cortactin